MKYNLYFHCSENTAFYIFTAMKYSFFKICIIFIQYFSVFHYFVYNKTLYLIEMPFDPFANRADPDQTAYGNMIRYEPTQVELTSSFFVLVGT